MVLFLKTQQFSFLMRTNSQLSEIIAGPIEVTSMDGSVKFNVPQYEEIRINIFNFKAY